MSAVIGMTMVVKRYRLDVTPNTLFWPKPTFWNVYDPNELVVAVRLTPSESVIETTALRMPRPSGVNTRPETVAPVGVGVGVGVEIGVGEGVATGEGLATGVGVGVGLGAGGGVAVGLAAGVGVGLAPAAAIVSAVAV